MKFIQATPNESGAYPPIQEAFLSSLPEGCALVPEDLDTSLFYQMSGFVSLTIQDGVVVGMTANEAAYQAYIDSLPEPEPPEPTEAEDTAALLVDHEYRLTLLELGVTDAG